MNCTPLVAGNGAVEALTKALALELGPRLRVNCFSPGYYDTERYDHLPPDRKALMLEATADSLPLKKVGTPADAGEALYFLATSSFTTGVVLDVDGGHQVWWRAGLLLGARSLPCTPVRLRSRGVSPSCHLRASALARLTNPAPPRDRPGPQTPFFSPHARARTCKTLRYDSQVRQYSYPNDVYLMLKQQRQAAQDSAPPP